MKILFIKSALLRKLRYYSNCTDNHKAFPTKILDIFPSVDTLCKHLASIKMQNKTLTI